MDEGDQEIRPLVYDGVMYIANPGSDHLHWLMAYRTYDFQAFSPLDRSHARTSASSGSPGCARWTRGTRRSGRWSTTA